MPAKNEQLIGAFASTLDFEQKLAILLTPNRYHEFSEERALLQWWLRRGYIRPEDYVLMAYGDPNLSLFAKYVRLGTSAWARQVVEMGDVTAIVAPASQVLGVEQETNDPVMKKDRRLPHETLVEMLSKSDLALREKAKAAEAEQEVPAERLAPERKPSTPRGRLLAEGFAALGETPAAVTPRVAPNASRRPALPRARVATT